MNIHSNQSELDWGEFRCGLCQDISDVHEMVDTCTNARCGYSLCKVCFISKPGRDAWGHEYCTTCDHNACNYCTKKCNDCKHFHCINCLYAADPRIPDCDFGMHPIPWYPK